jgi:hypothetical protein
LTDWADEIAEQCNWGPTVTVGDREALIAAALRKAKADGMREALELLEASKKTIEDDGDPFNSGWIMCCEMEGEKMLSLADKIEKGEA